MARYGLYGVITDYPTVSKSKLYLSDNEGDVLTTAKMRLPYRTFYFRPEQPLSYTAGQFTELTIPHKRPDERGLKRWFTLSSSPTSELLSITTKFNNDKSSSFKKALFGLKPGAELTMAEPMGDFVLPKLLSNTAGFCGWWHRHHAFP